MGFELSGTRALDRQSEKQRVALQIRRIVGGFDAIEEPVGGEVKGRSRAGRLRDEDANGNQSTGAHAHGKLMTGIGNESLFSATLSRFHCGRPGKTITPRGLEDPQSCWQPR